MGLDMYLEASFSTRAYERPTDQTMLICEKVRRLKLKNH